MCVCVCTNPGTYLLSNLHFIFVLNNGQIILLVNMSKWSYLQVVVVRGSLIHMYQFYVSH